MTDEQKPLCPECRLEVSGRFCGHCGTPTLLAQPTTWQSRFLEGSHPWAIDDAYLEATTLWSLLTQPFTHISQIPWKRRRAIIILALCGAVPLAAAILTKSPSIQYWTLALYFSLLWAGFFAILYHNEGADPKIALGMYFGTGLFSIPLLVLALQKGLESARQGVVASTQLLVALPANFLLVGIPEELAKALPLFVLCRFVKLPPLRLFIYYGLIAGLGFGFYEAMEYQRGMNLDTAIAALNKVIAASHDAKPTDAEKAVLAGYYVENVLRLTSSPFFHAVWTGIAAFFIWFGMRFRQHRIGFFMLAILLPAAFHGLYDGFISVQQPALTVLVAILSAALLGVFIGSAEPLERKMELLAGERPVHSPPAPSPSP
jgi:RsiW-degrading membrane proteinase PrsW (M82 family)